MIPLAIVAILSGAVLGTRFRIFVVLPVMALSCILIGCWAIFSDSSWLETGTAVFYTIAGIQLGYLVGLTLSSVVAADPQVQRDTRQRSPKSAADQPVYR